MLDAIVKSIDTYGVTVVIVAVLLYILVTKDIMIKIKDFIFILKK
jgi:hypothetical protein